MKKCWDKIKRMRIGWWLAVYLVLALGIRFWNYREAMYLIFDVGRDLIVLREMSLGDLKLIGQTTGLPGLFYGPLWYYVGLPGYVLLKGDPYGVQLWYVALAAIAIPLYWVLTHKLLGNNIWAKVAALLLALTPGGIGGTNFVWNVMLSVPLMTGAIYCLIQARESKKMLYLGFLLLALTLQAEFAYAVFLVTGLWLLIPWMRGKFEWKTMLVAVGVIMMTLIPQGLFELIHGFPMTKSLMAGLRNNETMVSFEYLWQQRPEQLWQVTRAFFIKANNLRLLTAVGLIGYWLAAVAAGTVKKSYRFGLILVITVLPYVCFMLWRGNYGYFFDYYMTPHFIPLVLMLVYGMKMSIMWLDRLRAKWLAMGISLAVCVLLGYQSWAHLDAVIIRPENNAGLKVMEQAVATLFTWADEDTVGKGVFRIYTPNMTTENYDYLVWWYAKQNGREHPSTVQSEDDAVRYVLYEPDEQIREKRFLPWYREATEGLILTRYEQRGVLTLETWMRAEKAVELGMEEV